MRTRPLLIGAAFAAAAIAIVVGAAMFSNPSEEVIETNAEAACANRLTGGFTVGKVFAEVDYRDEIAARAEESGLFEFENYVAAGEEIYYVTGTGDLGDGDEDLLCTLTINDGVATSVQYGDEALPWLR